jgi:hypothetical protein
MAKIKIDDKEYDTDIMSNEAKNALAATQFTETEIQRLQAKLAAMQTARMAYISGLKQLLEKGSAWEPTVSFKDDTIKFE